MTFYSGSRAAILALSLALPLASVAYAADDSGSGSDRGRGQEYVGGNQGMTVYQGEQTRPEGPDQQRPDQFGYSSTQEEQRGLYGTTVIPYSQER